MNIVVGSNNPTKVNAIRTVFNDFTVLEQSVPSDVASQPFSDEETKLGAINRAKNCVETTNQIGIGLEGGVMYVDQQLYLCNWGALATLHGQIFTASGARILLPEEIEEQLKTGTELGEIMDDYSKRNGVRNKEGAIGIFTNELVSRQEMFEHVAQLLRGQWEYWREF